MNPVVGVGTSTGGLAGAHTIRVRCTHHKEVLAGAHTIRVRVSRCTHHKIVRARPTQPYYFNEYKSASFGAKQLLMSETK
jgi:hypothetical protein